MTKLEPFETATDYHPTSRRPIAGIFRRTADGAVRWCVRAGVHPDAISYLSIASAAGAGACFWLAGRWPMLLILAPLLYYLRLWCNMLDGMVALASGNASRRGEILNDLPDRISDILIFAGVAQSGLCHAASAYWALIFALMTAYVGTLGQAVAGRREYGGVMSKPWRIGSVPLASTFLCPFARRALPRFIARMDTLTPAPRPATAGRRCSGTGLPGSLTGPSDPFRPQPPCVSCHCFRTRPAAWQAYPASLLRVLGFAGPSRARQ